MASVSAQTRTAHCASLWEVQVAALTWRLLMATKPRAMASVGLDEGARGALEQAVAPHRLRRPAAAAALLSVMGFDTVRGQASLLVTCHDHST